MYNILGSIAMAYLAGSGAVTNTSVVGRGLFRAVRHMVDGATARRASRRWRRWRRRR